MLTNFTTNDPAERIEAHNAWKAYKQPATGSMSAIEDKAIAAYHQVYELTGCEKRAAEVFFSFFNKKP
jgi:hypothetical protein